MEALHVAYCSDRTFSVVDDNPTSAVESGYSTTEGVHTYVVVVTDGAGNVGQDSVTYTVDNTRDLTVISDHGSPSPKSAPTRTMLVISYCECS